MTDDKTLLEAAANAAGIGELVTINGTVARYDPKPGVMQPYTAWNPLTDDGDALRLAAKLGMNVSASDEWDVCSAMGPWVSEPFGDDLAASLRRAIVRAAAEMGKKK